MTSATVVVVVVSWVCIASLLLFPSAEALAAAVRPVVSSISSFSGSTGLDTKTTTTSTPLSSASSPSRKRTISRVEKEEVDWDFDFSEDDDDDEFSLTEFLELQQSTGSEVLQLELQQQIDQALKQRDANWFLNLQGTTPEEVPSDLEKVAMSSVTAQLPQRAIQALSSSSSKKKKTTIKKAKKSIQPATKTSASTVTSKDDLLESASIKKTSPTRPNTNNLNYAGGQRVSHERELQLARLIQQGAALQRVRNQLQVEWQREPTRAEWAEAVQLSTKELRRRISLYRQAKQELVTANLGLVHAVVKHSWFNVKHSSGITMEELVQEGSLGLIRAAELFDPSRGLRFSTYAVVWIKGILSNSHVHELVHLPSREKTKWNKIVQALKEWDQVHPHVPMGAEQLADATGLTPEQIVVTQRRMTQAQRVLSLDYEYQQQSRSGTETSNMGGASLHQDKNLQYEHDLAERTQLHADVLAALARNLNAREARLMRLRYGLNDGQPRSLTECAQAMGLSYTRVHQLASRCLKKLRAAKEVEALEAYLLTIA